MAVAVTRIRTGPRCEEAGSGSPGGATRQGAPMPPATDTPPHLAPPPEEAVGGAGGGAPRQRPPIPAAPDPPADLALPSLALRALARRAAVPAALAAAAALALVVAGGPLQAFADAIRRALELDPR